MPLNVSWRAWPSGRKRRVNVTCQIRGWLKCKLATSHVYPTSKKTSTQVCSGDLLSDEGWRIKYASPDGTVTARWLRSSEPRTPGSGWWTVPLPPPWRSSLHGRSFSSQLTSTLPYSPVPWFSPFQRHKDADESQRQSQTPVANLFRLPSTSTSNADARRTADLLGAEN